MNRQRDLFEARRFARRTYACADPLLSSRNFSPYSNVTRRMTLYLRCPCCRKKFETQRETFNVYHAPRVNSDQCRFCVKHERTHAPVSTYVSVHIVTSLMSSIIHSCIDSPENCTFMHLRSTGNTLGALSRSSMKSHLRARARKATSAFEWNDNDELIIRTRWVDHGRPMILASRSFARPTDGEGTSRWIDNDLARTVLLNRESSRR